MLRWRDGYDRHPLHIQNARAKRARLEARRTNEDAKRPYVPFAEWLFYAKGIGDYRTMKRYNLWDAFNEYQLECLKLNLEFETGEKYNLYNTIY